MEAYTYLAQVYNELMFDVDYSDWASYLDTFLKQGKVSTVLEVALRHGEHDGGVIPFGLPYYGVRYFPGYVEDRERAGPQGRP